MYSLIYILPLISTITSGLLGRKLGVKGVHLFSTTSILLTAILGIKLFLEQLFEEKRIELRLFDWIHCETITIDWTFTMDTLSITMFLPVLIVSSLVHFYSIGYMNEDPHNQRFYSYLSLFTLAMIVLITGDNFLVMFLGWEGVGIASYLLIQFWFTRIQANKSALSALLTNKIGDMALLMGFFAIIYIIGNLDYVTLFSLAPHLGIAEITFIGIFLYIGAMAKSAQLGLHSWLPMAMEGPSNVSSLIHAATMVTAGVFLMIKVSPLIEYSSTLLVIILWMGALTAIFAALVGFTQNDIKKVIAYSTCSQLGMMFVGIGLSQYNLALYHLCNHAMFKALLFLSAGSIIHSIVDEQSMKKMGGFIRFLPFSYVMILIGSLSLMALPFMTGFYSKDLIIETAFGDYTFSSFNVYLISIISATFTSLYSMKLIYLTFFAKPNMSYVKYTSIHEPNLFMAIPLTLLVLLSIFFGYMTKDIFIGLASPYFANVIKILPSHSLILQTEFSLSVYMKFLPFILTILVLFFIFIVYEYFGDYMKIYKNKFLLKIYTFLNQRFFYEFFIERFFIYKALSLGYINNKDLERGILEIIGPYGINLISTKVSGFMKNLDTGLINNYALYMIIGLTFYVTLSFMNIPEYSIIFIYGIFFSNIKKRYI